MATYPRPSVDALKRAFKDHGVKYTVHPRQRSRAQWPDGLRAAVVHHTAGVNSVDYLATAWSLPGANCVINRDGTVVILAWGSAFHSGDGGPWSGVAGKNSAHLVSWGIEIEDKGVGATITAAQQATTGRMLAALVSLGMPRKNIVRHADWTDGTGGVSDAPLPTKGRKIDTRKDYGYTTGFWRDRADQYALTDAWMPATPKPGDLWDGHVPPLDTLMAAEESGTPNKATFRLACRLHDLGHYHGTPELGVTAYPRKAVANWQRSKGYKDTGLYGPKAHEQIFGR